LTGITVVAEKWPSARAGPFFASHRSAKNLAGKAMKTLLRSVLVLSFALGVGGCAVGTTRVAMQSWPLDGVGSQRSGTILVRNFKDVRQEDHKDIGKMHNAFGVTRRRFSIEQGKTLESLVPEYIAGALRHVGYNAVLQGQAGSSAPQAILDGEIKNFWMDMTLARARHRVGLRLVLLDRGGQHVKWQKNVEGEESAVIWIGITPEFERVINGGMYFAQKKAAEEFASEEFARAVRE